MIYSKLLILMFLMNKIYLNFAIFFKSCLPEVTILQVGSS